MEKKRDFVSLRKDTTSGIIEKEGIAGDDVSCVFHEWWNGEGIDFNFDEKIVQLDYTQLHCIAVAMSVLGMVDRDEVREDLRRMKESWNDRSQYIQHLAGGYD